MLVIIFPKEFERNLFLLSIKKENIIYLQEIFSIGPAKLKQELLLLGFKEAGGSKVYFVLVGVIGASDVDFTRCFELFFEEFKKSLNAEYSWPDRKNSFVFLNAGTCGGSFIKKDKIGDCFHITKAFKFDRGAITDVLDGGACKVVINEDMTLSASASWNPKHDVDKEDLATACTLSSNFLLNYDPHDFVTKCLPKLHRTLIDVNGNIMSADDNRMRFVAEMETYEFFMACVEHDIISDCFRIISDVEGDSYSIYDKVSAQLITLGIQDTVVNVGTNRFKKDDHTLSAKLYRLGRKTLDMSKLRNGIMHDLKTTYFPTNTNPNRIPEVTSEWGRRSMGSKGVAANARALFSKIAKLPDILELEFCDEPFSADSVTQQIFEEKCGKNFTNSMVQLVLDYNKLAQRSVYAIKSCSNNYFLDGRNANSRVLLTNRSPANDTGLNWTIEELGDDIIGIKNVASGGYLDGRNAEVEPLATVRVIDDVLKFKIENVGSGIFALKSFKYARYMQSGGDGTSTVMVNSDVKCDITRNWTFEAIC